MIYRLGKKIVLIALAGALVSGGADLYLTKINKKSEIQAALKEAGKVAEKVVGKDTVGKVTDFIGGGDDATADLGEIERVKDGDTFVVNIGGNSITVRLIGVDTPESVHSDSSRNTDWGKRVSKIVKKKIKRGTSVKLTYDEDKDDPYGRTLAYLYTGKQMFNKWLVKNGYARAVYYTPNGKYHKAFEKLQEEAKKAKRGFWRDGYSAAFPS